MNIYMHKKNSGSGGIRLLNDAWYIPAHSQLAIASALQAKTFAFCTLKCTARHLSHVIR